METCIGHVTHYFNHLGVAVLLLNSEIQSTSILHFCGHTTDFYQKAWSMEIDHHTIQMATPGTQVALKVAEPVREGDVVYVVMETTPGEGKDILFQQLLEEER